MVPGYGSPIGARDAVVVVDELASRSPNLVAGANRAGWHLRNVNVPRDYTPDVIADIANVREGDSCPDCGGPVILRNGIEVGNIFKLGTKYTAALGAEYLGEDGERHPIVMGSYGIGLGRNVACIVEAHHDEKGIIWPEEVAPYRAHLVALGANKNPEITTIADRLHDLASAAGPANEILYDDRDESPGVKFADADMLGMPWVLTVSPRSLEAGGIEVKRPRDGREDRAPDRGDRGLPGRSGVAGRLARSPGASWPAASSRTTTSTRGSRSRSTLRPRRSRSPGARCSGSTTRTSRGADRSRSSAPSASTSPTTG